MKKAFFAIAIFVSSSAILSQPVYAQVTPKGSVKFNAEDRLAVLNLVRSYGPTGDEGRLEEWRRLYWDDAVLVLGQGKEAATPDQAKEHETARGKRFIEEGIQRRHFVAAPMISSQTATEITGQAYVQVIWTKDGKGTLNPVGYYKFVATKRGDEWRFSRWELHLDTAGE